MSEYEKILLKKAKKGDVEAFEMLIKEHEKKAYNIAYRFLKNPDDAEDITQEAFLRAFKSIKKFRGKSKFSTWIYRIVTNTCIDFKRSQKDKYTESIDKKINYDGDELDYQLPDTDGQHKPQKKLEDHEISGLMHSMLNKLPDDHKTVLILRDIQGFSYKEIAEITNVSLGTVKSRINRARKALKELILEKGELFDDYIVK